MNDVQVRLRAALFAIECKTMYGPDQKRFGIEYANYLAGERDESPKEVFHGEEVKSLVDYYMIKK